jgi:Cu/Ag efflux protein CusF
MAQQSKTTLKTYFNTGDTPTEAQFVDLIDSFQDASAVLAATTASFTTANQTKLNGIETAADVTDAANVAAAGAVMNTGNSTIAGVKTFSSSPIVPAPTTDLQAATKKYVDDAVTTGGGYTDEAAQDAVGSIFEVAASKIQLTYDDSTPLISATINGGSIGATELDETVNESIALADTALQPADIGSTVQGYSAVLAATTASFTTADETKLDGIASGAEVNTIESVTSGEPSGSDAVLNVVSLTNAEYTAGSKTSTTLYIITDA